MFCELFEPTLWEKIRWWFLKSPFGPRRIHIIKAYWNLKEYGKLIWYIISNRYPPFEFIALPLVRKIFPSIFMKDLISIQPMKEESTSQIFYLDFITKKEPLKKLTWLDRMWDNLLKLSRKIFL